MPAVDPYYTLNVPKVCQLSPVLSAVLKGEQIAILDARTGMLRDGGYECFTVNEKRIYVVKGFVNIGINQEWLETPLGEGKSVYVPIYGGSSWLPLCFPFKWKVITASDPAPIATGYPAYDPENITADWEFAYVPVQYTDETCFADLCCNAWKYLFDPVQGAFVRHPNPSWNAIKGMLRKHLLVLSGGTDERVADYGRLILFLLSRASLSEEERAVFAPLLNVAPQAEALTGVIQREAFIQNFVAKAKENPEGFLAWGEDWAHCWGVQE